MSDSCNPEFPLWPLAVVLLFTVSEFMKDDGRKKRTAKHLCVTNITGLSLACYVVIFT